MSRDLTVLAECVDIRTGKRFPRGSIFNPAPTEEQAKRLFAAGCLPEGAIAIGRAADEKAAAEIDDEDDDDGEVALKKLNVEQLKALAVERKIDLGDATKKADIIAAIELATEA